jgi:hypothetical protein
MMALTLLISLEQYLNSEVCKAELNMLKGLNYVKAGQESQQKDYYHKHVWQVINEQLSFQ